MSANLLNPEEVRVFILGSTGTGKSSLGNTLLCHEFFQVHGGLSSGTQSCQFYEEEVDDKILQVIDTPGFMDTHKTEDEELQEVARTIAVSSPGPHVALLVIRCDTLFSTVNHRALCTLKTLLGPSLYSHSIVVFTFIDELTRDPEKRQTVLKEELQSAPQTLKAIVSACSDRCFAVDNRAPPEDRRKQSKQLLYEIMKLKRANGGRCFQNCMFKEVTNHINQLTQDHMRRQKSTPIEAARAIRSHILNGSVQLSFLKPIVRHLYYKKMETRVVLLGKTGVGKSTLGNILLGRKDFKVENLLSSTTAKCQSSETKVEDIVLQVTDTPGLCDTKTSYMETIREITKCVALTSPGPHVVLLVLRCDVKFTQEEHLAYQTLKKMYEGAICNHMILVFTHSDHLTTNPGERQTALKKFLGDSNERFINELMADCSGRCFAVENRDDREDQREQRKNLLTCILTLFRQNGGSPFNDENFQEISDDMEQRILTRIKEYNVTGEEATRTTRGNIEKGTLWQTFAKWIIIVRRRITEAMKEKMCTIM